jgi:hypothetical protein
VGQENHVSVSMFDHKPHSCPFGHRLWPGMAQVGWQPCLCTAALEEDKRAGAWGICGWRATPAATSSGGRRSISRRMTSATASTAASGSISRPPFSAFWVSALAGRRRADHVPARLPSRGSPPAVSRRGGHQAAYVPMLWW